MTTGNSLQIRSGTPENLRWRLGSLNDETIDTWDQIILWWWGCPVRCTIPSSVPGLCPLDASRHTSTRARTHPHTQYNHQNASRHCQILTGSKIIPVKKQCIWTGCTSYFKKKKHHVLWAKRSTFKKKTHKIFRTRRPFNSTLLLQKWEN